MNFLQLDLALLALSSLPNILNLKECFHIIERFVVLMYDCTSTSSSVNEGRKMLFSRKGRSLEGIPQSSDALFQHAKRALYQGGLCWGRSFQMEQRLPDPTL